MDREEAIQALKEGKTLTHHTFTKEETVKGIGKGYYEFEDGRICPNYKFWNYRQDKAFDDGWVIVSN